MLENIAQYVDVVVTTTNATKALCGARVVKQDKQNFFLGNTLLKVY